jgi:hypothetical protein
VSIQDLRLKVQGSDDHTVRITVIGLSAGLESEMVGSVSLDVRQGFLQIEVEKEKDWTSAVEMMVA